MNKLNRCKIKFDFEFGKINDRNMTVVITNNDQKFLVAPSDKQIQSIDFDIDLPTQVILKFAGKDPTRDTIVDKDGNITADVYVKILSITLDGFELRETFLYQKMKLVTDDGQEIKTAYIGFNGQIIIDMLESDVFCQYHSLHNI